MGISYNPSIVTDGLVLCLDAANRRSYPGAGTTWTDLSGNGNNGTLTNGPTFSAANGGSIVFDGVDDYVTIGQTGLPTGANPHTVMAWVNRTGSGGGSWNPLITWGSNSTNNKRFIFISSGQFSDNIFTGYYNNDKSDWPTKIALNTWTHVTWIFTGTSESIFLNSVSIGSRSVSNVNTVLDGEQKIGNYKDGAFDKFMQGQFKDICVYNRALSPQEIRQNYNATKGRYL